MLAGTTFVVKAKAGSLLFALIAIHVVECADGVIGGHWPQPSCFLPVIVAVVLFRTSLHLGCWLHAQSCVHPKAFRCHDDPITELLVLFWIAHDRSPNSNARFNRLALWRHPAPSLEYL
jgi:hypothetical protein